MVSLWNTVVYLLEVLLIEVMTQIVSVLVNLEHLVRLDMIQLYFTITYGDAIIVTKLKL